MEFHLEIKLSTYFMGGMGREKETLKTLKKPCFECKCGLNFSIFPNFQDKRLNPGLDPKLDWSHLRWNSL